MDLGSEMLFYCTDKKIVFPCIYPKLTASNIKFMGSYLIAWKLNDSDILSKFKMSKKFGKKNLDWSKICLILLFCFFLERFFLNVESITVSTRQVDGSPLCVNLQLSLYSFNFVFTVLLNEG